MDERKSAYATDARAQRAAHVIQVAHLGKHLGHDLARLVSELGLDEDDLAPPSLALARENAERSLPRDPRTGELYDLKAPLAAFDELGVEVAVYMRFIVYAGRLFVFLTVLNVANLITNMGAGSAEDLLSQMAINHADCPSNAQGLVELLNSVIIVAFLFWMRDQMHSTAARLKAQFEGNTTKLTAASFSVMVDNCPPDISADDLRTALGKFGTVIHVGIALDNRELVLALEARQALLLRAHEDGVRLLRAIRATRLSGQAAGSRPAVAGRAAVERQAAALEKVSQRLSDNGTQLSGLRSRPSSCVGKAFVTFNRTSSARACREAAGSISMGATALRIRPPPDPSQVSSASGCRRP